MPGKFGFKYVYQNGHIDNVLKKIKESGRPDTLTLNYLKKTWQLKNAQYGAVLDILGDMGFLDQSKPTKLYNKFQNEAKSKIALAEGIKNAYPKLFKAFPNANSQDRKTIEGYFTEHTGAEKSVLGKIIRTFYKLCSLADFENTPVEDKEKVLKEKTAVGGKVNTENTIPITMNIQIVIPSDATPEQYDAIFTSIKKNLTNK